ncbi:DUF3267 domain-containing protein [Sutcliffiella deserti]|uniref:DUF3267 domain-containing protein n=1 Tax=Sutcliffiella deserti TaxID=2875501 RepID=UPI001CBE8A21|nr:DUF3267 domain-containing protein [Sutcliffiella deserti]
MNCWKSINITKQYGTNRLTLISLILTLLSFILFYLSYSLIYAEIIVSSRYFGWFCLALASMFTLHKLCHALPLLATKKQVKFRWKLKGFMPYIAIKTKQSFSKNESYLVFLAPFLIITVSLIFLTSIFPSYYHYFSMLAALNIGLCFTDFLYIRHIQSAPSACQVEELDHGFDILLTNKNEIAS